MAPTRSFRQVHRWVSAAFLITVIVVSTSGAMGGPEWVNYVPLPPLFVLMITGTYLFVLPYRSRRRAAAPSA